MSVDPEPVITSPVINGDIEGLENIFLFPSHNDASAINATVDDIDRIVDVMMNLGSECAAETLGKGMIYGHCPHRYHMVTAHRLLTHCIPAEWAGLATRYVASGAGLRK
jgi:hypothetical protein